MATRLFALAIFLFSSVAAGAELPAADLWGQASAAADSGDFEEANRRLNDLMERANQLDLERFPLIAQSAAGLAKQARAEDNVPLSKWAIGAASKLDPDSPGVAFAQAELARADSNWPGVVRALIQGFNRVLRDYTTGVLARNDLMIVVALAIGLAAIAMALALLFSHGRAAMHDFRETLSGRFSPGVRSVLAFALLFLPLFLWLGPSWLVLWWLVLFFAYGGWGERIAVIVMLLLIAAIPPLLEWSAARTAGVQSPIVEAAAAATQDAYNPQALQRLQSLIELLPEEGVLHLLLGNLFVQHGSDSEALIHYRRALELDPNLAGAHLNMGNLHFVNNDFAAAISRYEQAAQIDQTMALAPYNHSIAAGRMFRYDEQNARLEEAKKRSRSLVNELTREAPTDAVEVVMWEMPITEAWLLSEQIARSGRAQELYGSYSFFDAGAALRNPLTLAALISIPLAFGFWWMRRRSLAGLCIKCGRTFCPRCKSSREAATYCTQCIHIYLKRDGVAGEAKKKKLEEVRDYQSRIVRVRRIMATFLPGTAQVLRGAAIPGLIVLLIFFVLVSMAILIGRLAPLAASVDVMTTFVRIGAIALAVILGLVFAIPAYRERPGQ